MLSQRIQTIGIALLLGLALAGPAVGQQHGEREFGAGTAITLDAAVARVRARTKARILAAETRHGADGPVHVIRIITRKGKVRHIRIDADTGRLLSKR